MKLNSFFVCGLYDLHFDFDLGEGVSIWDGLKITNNPEFVRSMLGSVNLRKQMGDLEFHAILNSKAVIFEFGQVIRNPTPVVLNNLITLFLSSCQSFAEAVWFLHDSNVYFEFGFLESQYQNLKSAVTSNFIHGAPYRSDGTRSPVSLTRNDLDQVIRFCVDRLIQIETNRLGVTPKSVPVTEFDRFARALWFLKLARDTNRFPIKVAQYCTCLEVLFSTSPSELKYRLAERLAFFLGETPEQKIIIVDAMGTAYDIRSATVHGSPLSKKLAGKARQASLACDDLLRRSLNRIASDSELWTIFSSENSVVDAYFKRLIFGI